MDELYKFFWNYNRVHEIYSRTKNERDRHAVERCREEWTKRFETGLEDGSFEFVIFMQASDDFDAYLIRISSRHEI